MIDPDDSDADRLAPANSKLRYLISKIINHTIDLLNHRLRQNLYLRAYFDRCDLTSPYGKTSFENCFLAGNYLPEGSVTPPRFDSPAAISDIDYTFSTLDTANQFRRAPDSNQIFVEMGRNAIALVRRAMLIGMALKEVAERG